MLIQFFLCSMSNIQGLKKSVDFFSIYAQKVTIYFIFITKSQKTNNNLFTIYTYSSVCFVLFLFLNAAFTELYDDQLNIFNGFWPVFIAE